MPIAEIINELDAYLSRLRQARELLLDGRTEAPQKGAPRRKRKVMVRQSGPISTIRRQGDENISRSNHPVAHLKVVRKRVDTSAPAAGPVADYPSNLEQAKITNPEHIAESIAITRFPARRRASSIISAHHRIAKPPSGNKPVAIKPAIALAGPTNTKVVVISAEQVQREREQASHPAVLRPRVPASGLSGKLAFESLFKDGAKPSKTSGL